MASQLPHREVYQSALIRLSAKITIKGEKSKGRSFGSNFLTGLQVKLAVALI